MVRPDRRRDEGNRPRGPTKRAHQQGESWSASQKLRKGPKPAVDENSEVVKAFRVFQAELDTKHDKHERLVKLSRDVTIESKRTIFLLHRITGEEDRPSVIREAQAKTEAIRSGPLLRIAQELEGEDPFCFQRAVSPGYQEYVEAVLFLCYVAEKRMMALEEVRSQLVFRIPAEDPSQKEDSPHPNAADEVAQSETSDQEIQSRGTRTVALYLSPLDYILGVADFTGELMRRCINVIGTGDDETPFALVAFMRELYDSFRLLGNQPGREFVRKLSTMRQSVSKVESACYMLRVRGSEIPKHMLLDAISAIPDEESAQADFES